VKNDNCIRIIAEPDEPQEDSVKTESAPAPAVTLERDDAGEAEAADRAQQAGAPASPAWYHVRSPFFVSGLFVFIFWGIYYLSYWLRFEGDIVPKEMQAFVMTAGWIVAVKLLVFLGLRIHHGWGRLVTFYDLVALAKATSASLLVILLADRFLVAASLIPRSVYLLDWGATIVAIGGLRSIRRGFREFAWVPFMPSSQIPALIVGANDTGELLLRAIIRDGRRTYRVLGFIDRDARRLGARIDGVPIIGTLGQTCELADRYGAEEILVVKDGLSGCEFRRLTDSARKHRREVRMLPSYGQLLSGKVSIQPRAVTIDDLLRREPVVLDMESIRRWIDGRVLMVTGSAGSIGSEICRQLLQFSPERLVLVDRSENGQFFLERELGKLGKRTAIDVCIADILDQPRMHGILEEYRPNVIFHAAAYKHVPLMEAHPGEAVKNIIVATRQLADAAAECDTESFVMISTDKAVNPTSVMGACKRVAEMYVQSLSDSSSCRFITVRFGNVLDSAGSVVQIFRQQILEGGPVTVTHPEMRRFFMTIPEASQLVIQAGAIGRNGQILLLDMGEPVRVVDLAADMIQLSGLRVGEDIALDFVGLRPGEKLYEELYSAGERQLPTCHPKIIVADHKPTQREPISRAVERLERLARQAPSEVVARLAELLPEYRSEQQASRPRRRAAA
jgi:FlaA1/EpsC-like NDP-sugar epimerase